jgi:hypothetical protein
LRVRPSPLGNDRQQQEIFPAAADVDAGFAAVDCHRSVARIVVQKWTTAGELVLHV